MKKYLTTIISSVLFVASAAAQTVSPLDRMMELNRTGRWEQAAEMAEQFLKETSAKTLAEKCQGQAQLAYSRMRLRQGDAARSALSRFDGECRELPAGNWLKGFAESIRKELAAPPSTAPAPTRRTPSAPSVKRDDGFWRTADPASVGVDKQTLEEHQRLCVRSGADACLVIRKGKIVQEIYSPRYAEPMYAMSSTKSVTGLLAGMFIDDGRIKTVDEPVCKYVSEWCEGRKAKVTLRHLLTMTSGLPRMWDDGVSSTGDKNRLVINLSPTAEPGSKWDYTNEGVQLLSPILDKAAGEPVQDYARRRLFEPLGMTETRLHLDGQGHAWTYADMETTARDFARLGLLMLNKGAWQGRQVVSASWVEQSTQRSQPFERYGLLWWLYESPKGYAALGYLDTNLYVFPALDLVVVRMQSKPLAGQTPYESEALRLFGRMVKQ